MSAIAGVRLAYPVEANGVFASLPPAVTEALQTRHPFYVWDEATGVVRWMTSFDTSAEDVDALVEALGESMATVPIEAIGPSRRTRSVRLVARRTPRAGGTGECLGDGHPLMGPVTGDRQAGIGHVAALGDHEAEVECRPVDGGRLLGSVPDSPISHRHSPPDGAANVTSMRPAGTSRPRTR